MKNLLLALLSGISLNVFACEYALITTLNVDNNMGEATSNDLLTLNYLPGGVLHFKFFIPVHGQEQIVNNQTFTVYSVDPSLNGLIAPQAWGMSGTMEGGETYGSQVIDLQTIPNIICTELIKAYNVPTN